MEPQAFPVNSSSEEWWRLLQDTLGKEEGAAVAASLGCSEIVINVTSSEDQASGQMGSKITNLGTQKSGAICEGHGNVETCITCSAHDNSLVVPIVITEEPDSVLHVVAAAGDNERHLEATRMIYRRASHLLTTAAAGNSKGDTPLHLAARAGNTKMVACLIELAKGANGVDYEKATDLVRMRNKRGETALHEAVRFDNARMVQDLISADKELAQIYAENGTSPLYLACSVGDIRTVRLILHEGKEPSYSGPHGQNALHAAVLQNWKATTELLLQQKDLAKQRDRDGSTPLHFAASAPDPFFKFTFSFFSINLSISYLPRIYFLPLTWIVQLFGSKRPIIQLLAADPTCAFQPDSNGSFPVHIAASADCMVSLFALLARYPACARLRDAEGKSFLHVAVEKKRVTVVQIACLLFGERPFFKSVVNIQDQKGDTALHLAVRHGELRIARYLIGNKHVHINLENRQGKTPMDLASGAVKSGFYFGVSAPRRILNILTFVDAQSGNRRRDLAPEYSPRLEEEIESDKIKDFAQIVGIGSVLVATATFTAALTMPGGVWSPGDSAGKKLDASPPLALAGTPLFAGSYAFDGFVISNTLAFMCSTLATFSLVYCGVAAVDIDQRFQLVTFSLALLLFSARSFCAAFAFALYLLLDKVAHETGTASIVMTSFALLDGLWFLVASLNDLIVIIGRKKHALLRYGHRFLLGNILYPFWPYLLMGCYLVYDFRTGEKSQP